MPNELAIQAVTVLRTASDTSGDTKAAAFDTVPLAGQEAAASPIPNPSLQLDPALGLVVIEFRNNAGSVTTSIPSERQIAAYQRWEQTKFGPAPAGMHKATVSVAASPTQHEPAAQAAPEPAPHTAAGAPMSRVMTLK